MASDWEISRATGKCVATGRELAEGEVYYAALFETAEGFERRDYSTDGWQGVPEGCFCHFKTRMPTRGRKPATIAVDTGLLVTLFCRLEDDDSPMRQKFRFVLALLLMRKRLLRMDKSDRQDNQEIWHMRLATDKSIHQVVNPNLSNAEIERLSAQMTALLSGDASVISSLEEDSPDEASAHGDTVSPDNTVTPDDAALPDDALPDDATPDDAASNTTRADPGESGATGGSHDQPRDAAANRPDAETTSPQPQTDKEKPCAAD